MARSRRGRKSNIGKQTYPWSRISVESDASKQRYNKKQQRREYITSKLHLADSTRDFDTYLFIAEYLNIHDKDLSKSELRKKVWDACDDMSHADISRLYDKLNPSYDK